ncbi:hypothetical protein PybrP1_008016 [[Pythium] brassicae (nom. inval.)]|nr:hypothetical protein PybrP1_008016 [[Pythium] brassicae (nom. inval.)]
MPAPVAYKSGPTSSTASAPGSPDSDDGSDIDGADGDGAGRNDALKSNRLCTMPGCKKRVRSKGLCKAHGGGRRCMVEGCERSSQGQGLCIRHGGGKRCTQTGCTKASQSNGLCKAHGGGLRCQTAGCTKSSQGGGFCRAHGGGQRCEKEGCSKGAQRGGFCAGHGGSRFCQHPDCTKNDRGGGYCAEHGGGKRCDAPGCNKPARKKGKCSFHANALKGKAGPKDALAGGGAASSTNIMDMRQITTPAFATMAPSSAKDVRPGSGPNGGASADSHTLEHPVLRYPQQRPEMDMRYPKGYDQGGVPMPAGQYMQMHPDQRPYDPMGMPSHAASRHYMALDHAATVAGGAYAPQSSHKQQAAYSQREPMKPSSGHHHPAHAGAGAGGLNPYSQAPPQWTAKENAGPPNAMQDRASLDYFDMKDPPPHHHQPYPTSASQYHHHHHHPHHLSDSAAAAAAAYNSQRGGGGGGGSYGYHHPHAQAPPGAADGSGQQGMMYYSPNGYPPQHQMHSLQHQMQLL